jgi:hypothetical protein
MTAFAAVFLLEVEMQSLQGPRKPAVGCHAARHAHLEARVILPVPVMWHSPLQAVCRMKLTERREITPYRWSEMGPFPEFDATLTDVRFRRG